MATRDEIIRLLQEDPEQLERFTRAAGTRNIERKYGAANFVGALGGGAPSSLGAAGMSDAQREQLIYNYSSMLDSGVKGRQEMVKTLTDANKSIDDRIDAARKNLDDRFKAILQSQTEIANQNTTSATQKGVADLGVLNETIQARTELTDVQLKTGLTPEANKVLTSIGTGGPGYGGGGGSVNLYDIVPDMYAAMATMPPNSAARQNFLINANTELMRASGGQVSIADVLQSDNSAQANELAAEFGEIPAYKHSVESMENFTNQLAEASFSEIGRKYGANASKIARDSWALANEMGAADMALIELSMTPEGQAQLGRMTPDEIEEYVSQHAKGYDKVVEQAELEIARLKQGNAPQTYAELRPDLLRNQLDGVSGGRRGMRQTLRAARSLARTDNEAAAHYAEAQAQRVRGTRLAGGPPPPALGYQSEAPQELQQGQALPDVAPEPGVAPQSLPVPARPTSQAEQPAEVAPAQSATAMRIDATTTALQRDAEDKRAALLARMGSRNAAGSGSVV